MKNFAIKHFEIICIAIRIAISVLSLLLIYTCSKTEIITPKHIEYSCVIQRQKDSIFFYEIKGIQNGIILIDNIPSAKGTIKDSNYNFQP